MRATASRRFFVISNSLQVGEAQRCLVHQHFPGETTAAGSSEGGIFLEHWFRKILGKCALASSAHAFVGPHFALGVPCSFRHDQCNVAWTKYPFIDLKFCGRCLFRHGNVSVIRSRQTHFILIKGKRNEKASDRSVLRKRVSRHRQSQAIGFGNPPGLSRKNCDACENVICTMCCVADAVNMMENAMSTATA